MSRHAFCRAMLATVMEDVRRHTTVEQRKDAWAYRYSLGSGTAEFHGPDPTTGERNGFYWHGRADCLWSARYEGWSAWLEASGDPQGGSSGPGNPS